MKIDANSEELGALLEQNHGTLIYPKWYPVGYASRSLQDYKKRYTQFEKETLSTVFGVERFHEYLYGCKFTVINVNQPLKPIFGLKSIVICLPHTKKFFLRSQKCEFDFKYSIGKTKLNLDAISLAYIIKLKTRI